MTEHVCNRLKLDFNQKDGTDKKFKQQSKLTLNGIHKSYEIVIVILLDKMMFLWISLYMLVSRYWN